MMCGQIYYMRGLERLNRSSEMRPRYSLEESLQASNEKLPFLHIKKVLKKIGIVSPNKGFIPNEEEQAKFRTYKTTELIRRFSLHKKREDWQPYDNEIDEIVLGCWKSGENAGRRTVWKKYRENCDSLTFDTLLAIRK